MVEQRCRTCELRAMSDEVAELPDGALWEVESARLRHLTDGSGWTICGKNCAEWERRASAS